ncbi:hypothetical protein, partial [Morganella morganii]|uniref:hypothetical protein n=1 Tax=Morganella morganii TaxID=582 RepID=UPI001953FA89
TYKSSIALAMGSGMNSLITFFQGLASHVPELVQPFIIALAGAVPFVEGEVSAVIAAVLEFLLE